MVNDSHAGFLDVIRRLPDDRRYRYHFQGTRLYRIPRCPWNKGILSPGFRTGLRLAPRRLPRTSLLNFVAQWDKVPAQGYLRLLLVKYAYCTFMKTPGRVGGLKGKMAFVLKTFGRLQLVDGDGNDVAFPEKGLLLLAYLLTTGQGSADRTTLVSFLWGDAERDDTLATLRKLISRMRPVKLNSG